MSLQNRLLTWALRTWIKPNSLHHQDVAAARALTARVPFGAKLPPGWRARPVQESGLDGEWIEPAASANPARTRCILYLHGGAYVAMSARTHRPLTSRLATWSDARLFALDYRLAPEHPFPAALEDALAVWDALVAEGVDPAKMAIGGDSAGGGLTLALMLSLKAQGRPLPACGWLISPWTDLAMTGATLTTKASVDPLISEAYLTELARQYLAGADPANPLISPLRADLAGLPPLLIQVGSAETLLDDAARIAERAGAADVAVTLEVWPHMIHAWPLWAAHLESGRRALAHAGAFIRARLSA